MDQQQVPRPCSAKYKEDFAYVTIKDRLPVILTKVIDVIHKEAQALASQNEQDLCGDLQGIVGRLSAMKYSLQTDKPLTVLSDDSESMQEWNDYYDDQVQLTGKPPSWFTSSWLYVECFFYRHIYEAIALSEHFKSFDPFAYQKKRSLTESVSCVTSLALHLDSSLRTIANSGNSGGLEKLYLQLLQVDLWGNKCDLSISASQDNYQTADPIGQLKNLEKSILVDDSAAIWQQITDANTRKPNAVHVDIVLDNAGFEFFCDLCLAVFLVDAKLASVVRLHGKCIPWFVSDVTATDFVWTIDQLTVESGKHVGLQNIVKRLKQYLHEGAITFEVHSFWTLPHDFTDMKAVAPDLYKKLRKSDLVFFKGDLNYRKLVGDRKWDATTPFEKAVLEFRPAPFCVLRTVKCDVIVGLREGQMDEIVSIDSTWMQSSVFAMIQYLPCL